MERFALWLVLLAVGSVAHAKTVHLYYTDAQGTVVAKTDAQGNILARYDYRPYGAPVSGGMPAGPGYTGHVNDPEIGLVYMQQRYYDPNVGAFLSADPMNSFSGNRYAYASNNPIVNIDPDGRQGRRVGDECSAECKRREQQAREHHNNLPFTGGGVAPKNTPSSMLQYFRGASPSERTKAAVAVMNYFHISQDGITCWGFATWAGINAQMNPNGQLDISEALFTHSFGLIGAILSHEVEGLWQMQYMHMSSFEGLGTYSQSWYMREIQAYDYELSKRNISRFGLTPAEVTAERVKRDFYLKYVSPANQALIGQGIYKPF
jgi:RHS repeat-associated protein